MAITRLEKTRPINKPRRKFMGLTSGKKTG